MPLPTQWHATTKNHQKCCSHCLVFSPTISQRSLNYPTFNINIWRVLSQNGFISTIFYILIVRAPSYNIQILTGTVMKYHVSVDCQESYIFPRDYIFPRSAQHWGNILSRTENITILAPPTRDISSVPVDICYIRWSKWMISSKFYVLYDPTKFGNKLGVCIQNKTERKLDSLRAFYYDVLLLTTAYSAYAVHFFLGQFPNMELMLLSPLFYLLNCYIFVIASLRLL